MSAAFLIYFRFHHLRPTPSQSAELNAHTRLELFSARLFALFVCAFQPPNNYC
jgi:hypothetical protein